MRLRVACCRLQCGGGRRTGGRRRAAVISGPVRAPHAGRARHPRAGALGARGRDHPWRGAVSRRRSPVPARLPTRPRAERATRQCSSWGASSFSPPNETQSIECSTSSAAGLVKSHTPVGNDRPQLRELRLGDTGGVVGRGHRLALALDDVVGQRHARHHPRRRGDGECHRARHRCRCRSPRARRPARARRRRAARCRAAAGAGPDRAAR